MPSLEDILKSLTPEKCEMWHHASCIQGEAGELFDAVKKHIIYNKILEVADLTNVIEELGDLEFYMEGLRQAFNVTRQQTLDHNASKLSKRYQFLIVQIAGCEMAGAIQHYVNHDCGQFVAFANHLRDVIA